MILLYLCAVSGAWACAAAQVFASVEKLSDLFVAERNFVDKLSTYIDLTERKLARMKNYVSAYNYEVEEELKRMPDFKEGFVSQIQAEELAGNPLQAYKLLKRITIDMKHLGNLEEAENWAVVEDSMRETQMQGSANFTDESELRGAARAILRLQDIYQLRTDDLVGGNLMGDPTQSVLDIEDCLYLGKHAFNYKLYNLSMSWFMAAHRTAGMRQYPQISQPQIEGFISSVLDTVNGSTSSDDPSSDEYSSGSAYQNYGSLCRGETMLNSRDAASLKCFFDDRESAYLRIMPAKVEEHHKNPPVWVFHDAVTEREIEILKSLSKNEMSRAKLQATDSKGKTTGEVRVSNVAWLSQEVELSALRNLQRRSSYLSGLQTDIHSGAAERLQVCNYGVGGHYSPHLDYLMRDKKPEEMANFSERDLKIGDRMATLMFYLTDVKRGGATAFPRLGISLFPEKGSAAFWYNLKRSGEGESLSLHGGCPVVHGSKWVTNRWIREASQMNRRPCGLSSEE